MADFSDPTAAVEARLKYNWLMTAVAWPNAGAFTPAAGQSYIELNGVQVADARVTSFPAAHPLAGRVSGAIVLMVNVPRGRGTREANMICEALAELFSPTWPVPGIVFRMGTPTPVGQRGEYWSQRYTVPFYYNTRP